MSILYLATVTPVSGSFFEQAEVGFKLIGQSPDSLKVVISERLRPFGVLEVFWEPGHVLFPRYNSYLGVDGDHWSIDNTKRFWQATVRRDGILQAELSIEPVESLALGLIPSIVREIRSI